ncbi:uncharacterized protein BO97DRAFT_349459, partial [Aspergillus homomorphus CBS 101889]
VTYYPDIETMIVKVPGCYKPGLAFGMISDGTFAELRAMGVGRAEIEPTEHTTYTAPLSGSRKEGGCGRKNALLRSLDNGCPHFVIEAGLSESLPGLRQDVNWWFANSGETGALLALLISISRANRTTTIEKYHPIPRQTQATGGGVVYVKHLVSTTIVNMGISAAAVEGQPLVLGFHRIVGRQPVGLEHDLTFTGITLLEIGRAVFRN